MICLVLKPRTTNADDIEFHPAQVGKRMFPFRDGHLIAFWRTVDEAKQALGKEPLLLALMSVFDVAFWPMDRVHRDLQGKPLMKIDLRSLTLKVPTGDGAREEQPIPFDLVYAITPAEVAMLRAEQQTATASPPAA